MDLKITNGFYDPSHLSYEVVERKGLGHPDTLADGIAEQIEIDYSLYCWTSLVLFHIIILIKLLSEGDIQFRILVEVTLLNQLKLFF